METKLEELNAELLVINEEIEAYLEDLQEQKDNLLSLDLEDEFDGSILVGASQCLKDLGEKKRAILMQLANI